MRPLNYAILNYMTTVDKASAEQVVEALKPQYEKHRQLTVKAVKEALMTAEQNGLLEEVDCDLDEKDKLTIYYRADEECKKTIHHYIK